MLTSPYILGTDESREHSLNQGKLRGTSQLQQVLEGSAPLTIGIVREMAEVFCDMVCAHMHVNTPLRAHGHAVVDQFISTPINFEL